MLPDIGLEVPEEFSGGTRDFGAVRHLSTRCGGPVLLDVRVERACIDTPLRTARRCGR
ncbi:hypothetical protein BH20ACT2_BH20ACT2_08970 [soil metagenome]